MVARCRLRDSDVCRVNVLPFPPKIDEDDWRDRTNFTVRLTTIHARNGGAKVKQSVENTTGARRRETLICRASNTRAEDSRPDVAKQEECPLPLRFGVFTRSARLMQRDGTG